MTCRNLVLSLAEAVPMARVPRGEVELRYTSDEGEDAPAVAADQDARALGAG